MNKISIITINYNNDLGLEKTIKSVLNQSFELLEYIVIDGNSTDNSKSIIEKYKSKLDYWVSEDDNGIYNAMNKGIQRASGDYLLFMNSGDVLIDDPDILSACEAKLLEDIVAFDCFLEKDNQIVGKRTHIQNPTLYYVYQKGLKHQSTFIKKSMFDNYGLYDESFKISGDYEFWIRCLLSSKTIAKGHDFPIAVFQLDGISQKGGWGAEHEKVYEMWLSNLISDFRLFDKLKRYQNSRILNMIIKILIVLRVYKK